MIPRWRVGVELTRSLYRNGQCVGMVDSPKLAEEIVAALNNVAPNDREAIGNAILREANRVFNGRPMDYPSNILDAVSWNIRAGEDEFLSERKHPSGRGIEKPDPEDCPGCEKVRRHPGEGYACAWHPHEEAHCRIEISVCRGVSFCRCKCNVCTAHLVRPR